MMMNRRTFFIQQITTASAVGLLAAGNSALAQSAVAEGDAQAQALGYRADGSKVDTKKHPNYNASQSCSGCALFQGKAGDASASCAVFGNKLVSGKGWCAAWSKRG